MLAGKDEVVLLEREQELDVWAAMLAEAMAGNGGALLAEGPAGIGKTRLLEVMIEEAADRGFTVHRARGDELETSFPYGVVHQLLDRPVGDWERGARDRLVGGPARVALSLLEGQPVPLHGDRGDVNGAIEYSLYWLVQELADDRPQLLVVDDAEWADAPSLRTLHYLGRRMEGLSVMIALARRTSAPSSTDDMLGRLGALPCARRLRLRPLGEQAVGQLVSDVLGAEVDAVVRRSWWLATRGNPLFVRELLTSVDATELGQLAGDPVALARAASQTMGGRSVLRRVEVKGQAARQLAQAVAVLGEAALFDAAVVAELDEAQAVAAADRLVAADILEATPRFRFVHPVLREVVLAAFLPAQRALAHARAARALVDGGAATEQVSAHLLQALPRGDAWAADTLLDAGITARARGGPQASIKLLRRALAEPPPAELRWRVALELGTSQAIAGHPVAMDTLHQAVGWAQESSDRTVAVLRLARMTATRGDHYRALTMIDELAAASSGVESDALLQLRVEYLGMARLVADTREQALEGLARLRHAALPPRPATVGLLSNLALSALERNAPPAEVAELAELSMTEGWLLDDETFQLAYGGGALIWIDRFDTALQLWDEAVDTARRRGSLTLAVLALALRSHLHLRRGAVADAEADARIAHQIATEHSWPHGTPFTRAHLASALVERGDRAQARGVLDGTTPEERAEENPFYLYSCGQLLLAGSDPAAAHDRFLACGRALAGRGGVDTPSMFAWRSQAALALLHMGEIQQAHDRAVEELELARIMGVPAAVGEALVALALTEDGEQGIARLRKAVTVLEGSPRVLARIRGLLELGAMLRRHRHRRAAQPFLRRALDLGDRHGATVLADRARTELRACGARPRRAALTGADALTASERRIAALAGEGLTNRDIAQRLYVSPRTVATHLTHVYQKLGVDGREQLSQASRG